MKKAFNLVGLLSLAAGLLIVSPQVHAAPGDLDTTYGTGGIASSVGFTLNATALQSDGKIVAVGTSSSNFTVARYNTDGSLDTTFGTTGIVTTDILGGSSDTANNVRIQSDGKIVVVGSAVASGAASFAVVRYNSNGSLDTSFGTSGIVTTVVGTSYSRAYDVAIQSDGKIVAVGSSYAGGSDLDFAIARYTSSGALDTTFSSDGKATKDIGRDGDDVAVSVAIQSDGKIVLGGSDYKYNSSGQYTERFALVRYTTSGSLDSGFSGDGVQTTNFGSGTSTNPIKDAIKSIALQSDGKIVAAGFTQPGTVVGGATVQSIALARYNTNGSLDTGFSSDGKVDTVFPSGQSWGGDVAIQSDGKIVVVGYNSISADAYYAVVRYNTNGSLDTGFSGDGIVTTAVSTTAYPRSVTIQSDGKIVAAGGGYLVRYIGASSALRSAPTTLSGNVS